MLGGERRHGRNIGRIAEEMRDDDRLGSRRKRARYRIEIGGERDRIHVVEPHAHSCVDAPPRRCRRTRTREARRRRRDGVAMRSAIASAEVPLSTSTASLAPNAWRSSASSAARSCAPAPSARTSERAVIVEPTGSWCRPIKGCSARSAGRALSRRRWEAASRCAGPTSSPSPWATASSRRHSRRDRTTRAARRARPTAA